MSISFGQRPASNLNKEYYDDQPLIPQFIQFALNGNVHGSDILGEFDRIEKEMREKIDRSIQQSRNTARKLFSYITRSNQFLDIRALVTLWGNTNQEGYQLMNLFKKYETIIKKIRHEIAEYIRQGH